MKYIQAFLRAARLLPVAAVLACAAPAAAYDTLPAWTLAWTNSARTVGTLTTDAAHGGWTLNVVLDKAYYSGYGLKLGIYSGKAFYGSAVAAGGTGEGATGELDMRGTITGPGLDGTGTSTDWKIATLPDACLRTDDGNGHANAAYAVKILRTPGTLLSFGPPYHNDGKPYPVTTEIYVDEPSFTGMIPAWLASGCTNLNILVLKVPKATAISCYVAHMRQPQRATRFDDFELDSVKTLIGHATGGCFMWWGAVGTLDVPALEQVTVSNACKGASLGAALLGTKGRLAAIAEGSFLGCNNLSNIVIGASPSGTTLALGAGAFSGTGVKRVWFCGTRPPAIATRSGWYAFGTATTPQGQITFYVPDTPDWASVLAQADAADGLVPADVFNTAQPQYVRRWNGIVHLAADFGPVDTTLASAYGDTVELTNSDSDTSGFPYATAAHNLHLLPLTLTATATASPDAQGRCSTFHRWDGVALARERTNPLEITVGTDVSNLRCFFAHDWFYDTSAQTIANGNWVIKVSVVDAAKRTLRIGNNTANGTYSTALTGTGTGVLDFNGAVRDGDGNAWTLTDVKSYALCRARKWDTSKDTTATFADHPRVVVFPETVTSIGGSTFNFNQSQNFPLEEVVLIAPELTGTLGWTINGPCLLTRLLLRAPKLTGIGSNAIWQNASLSDTDVTTWDLSSVTSVSAYAFVCSTGMKGTLNLPALQTLGARNFQNHKALNGVVLATNLTFATVGSNAFLNATSLKTVTFGNAKAGVSVGQNAFKGATGVTSVTFLGPRDEPLADAVLTGVAASDGAKAATLYASQALGWGASAAALTVAETALAPAHALGVYRAGARKAWLVRTPSPFDPRGTLLIVR